MICFTYIRNRKPEQVASFERQRGGIASSKPDEAKKLVTVSWPRNTLKQKPHKRHLCFLTFLSYWYLLVLFVPIRILVSAIYI